MARLDRIEIEGCMFDDPRIVDCPERIAMAFRSPEDINDAYATAPSRRIASSWPEYRKNLHGPVALGAIGLETIRSVCPHFGEWLAWLESLTGPSIP